MRLAEAELAGLAELAELAGLAGLALGRKASEEKFPQQERRKRLSRLAFVLDSDLAPVAFNEDPAAVAVNPVVGNPMRTGMGWTIPAAGDPDVAAAVPALISVNPHKATLWRPAALFDDDGWGANANDNLRKRSCRSQTEG